MFVKESRHGTTCAVVTLNDGIVYKRIYNHIEDKKSILLSSDDKEYNPFEVIELLVFICSINTLEHNEKELKISSIMQMFNDLKVELETFNGKLL